MGRFGVEFSDQSNRPFKISKKRHYGSTMTQRGNLAPDSTFQRTLAWASYYVLVFAALCVFNKPAMAEVMENTSAMVAPNRQAEHLLQDIYQWELRVDEKNIVLP